ncbi:MAG: sulfatase, partial [Phycisphaerae bacterium]|nr:sulfatase [Phycisphaerae bacterium]
MDPVRLEHARAITRRHFLTRMQVGIGGVALAALLDHDAARAATPGGDGGPRLPPTPHFAPRAKRIIYLHMAGSPPQQDLF